MKNELKYRVETASGEFIARTMRLHDAVDIANSKKAHEKILIVDQYRNPEEVVKEI